jgi:hypothetical protein
MKNANLFVDEANIAVHSGSGGNGVVRFRREKFAANGGPNGGDGGRGGDIILVADTNIGTLLDLKSARIIKAQNGDHGGSSNRKGASGEHVEVRVPLGTLVFDLDKIEDGVELEEIPPIADLTQQGQTFTVAKGGQDLDPAGPRLCASRETRRIPGTPPSTEADGGRRSDRLSECRQIDAPSPHFRGTPPGCELPLHNACPLPRSGRARRTTNRGRRHPRPYRRRE